MLSLPSEQHSDHEVARPAVVALLWAWRALGRLFARPEGADPGQALAALGFPEGVLGELARDEILRRDGGRPVVDDELGARLSGLIRAACASAAAPAASPRPRWDRAKRELWLGECLVKRVAPHALAQLAVLDALEDAGWPEEVTNPLGGLSRLADGGVIQLVPSKKARRNLTRAVRGLNQGQRDRVLGFATREGGRRLSWQITYTS